MCKAEKYDKEMVDKSEGSKHQSTSSNFTLVAEFPNVAGWERLLFGPNCIISSKPSENGLISGI